LPESLVRVLKRITLDTLGTSLAATTLGSGCRELIEMVRAWGGAPQSTLVALNARVPSPMAALANGACAHALNYDDVFAGGGHLGCVTVPAGLAIAERQGGISGKELLTALAAGVELMARLQLAVRAPTSGASEARPQPTQLMGAFAAAATVARVLRLDAPRTWSAIGLALMQASGNRQPVLEGTSAKALYAAFPNHAGVLSALLAERGMDARCAVFKGEAGLLPTSYSAYDAGPLRDRLGAEFVSEEVGFKPWPTTNHAHVFIQAAITIASRARPAPASIQRIVIRGGPLMRTFCEPIHTRRRPSTWVEAEDSIPFAVAKALVNKTVVLADFMPDGLRQPDVLALADRLDYAIDPDLGPTGSVEVILTNGDRLVDQVAHPRGHPRNPLSNSDLQRKFFDCASHAATPIPGAVLDRIVESIDHLEHVDDVRLLPDLLARRYG
jgi:2-methylcitrate dehydratase PrpD